MLKSIYVPLEIHIFSNSRFELYSSSDENINSIISGAKPYRNPIFEGKDNTLPYNYTDPVSMETIKKHFENKKILDILKNKRIASQTKLSLLMDKYIISKPTELYMHNLTVGLEVEEWDIL